MADDANLKNKKAAQKAAVNDLKAAKKRAKTAKKEAAEAAGEDESLGGKILVGILALIIIAIWLGILALLVKMDVGGFGSTVLYPVLKDVPILCEILPETNTYADEDSAYAYLTVEDAVERIKELEQELADVKATVNDNAALLADLEAQAEELQAYKDAEAEFEALKEKFYEEVVFSDDAVDIENYKTYYESIDSANAEAIYKQVIEQLEYDEEITEYANTYANMKPAAAAAIMDELVEEGNTALAGKILWAMTTQSRADILNKMDTTYAAAVTELMEPGN